MKVQIIDNIWKRADVPAPDGLYSEFEDAIYDAFQAEDIHGFVTLAAPLKKHLTITRQSCYAFVKHEGRTIAIIHY